MRDRILPDMSEWCCRCSFFVVKIQSSATFGFIHLEFSRCWPRLAFRLCLFFPCDFGNWIYVLVLSTWVQRRLIQVNLAKSSPHFLSAPGALVIVGERESDLALAGMADLAATPRYSWRWSLVELIYPDADTPLCIDWLNAMVMVVAMVTELPMPTSSSLLTFHDMLMAAQHDPLLLLARSAGQKQKWYFNSVEDLPHYAPPCNRMRCHLFWIL